MNLIRRIQYSQYWNIGFCVQTAEDLISCGKLKKIQWLDHSYRDRWFADPFIYKVTKDEVVVFVEECLIESPKGIISELHVDRSSLRLKERYILLERDTHVSYPIFYQSEGKTYVCPENGAAGELNIYEYDEENHCLFNPVRILDENLGDASIVPYNNKYYLIATRFPDLFQNALLYESQSLLSPFSLVSPQPAHQHKCCARPGGAWFEISGQWYRPAQNCVKRYGSALSIMKVNEVSVPLNEELVFQITPQSFRYNLGIHTINFCDGLCVVDGYGYLCPVWGSIYYSKLIQSIIKFVKQYRKV